MFHVLKLAVRRRTIFLVVAAVLLSLCIPLALTIKLGAFPDELAHLGYVLDVSHFGFPDYRHGTRFDSTLANYLNHPPLYYLLAGLEATGLDLRTSGGQFAIRMVNTFVSLVTLWLVFRILVELEIRAAGVAFGLLFWVSIPMLPALGSSVNNDPLSFLGAALFIWGLVRWHLDRPWSIDLMVLGAGVAALTKATAALGVLVLALSYAAVNVRDIASRIPRLRRSDWLKIGLLLGIVAAFYGAMIVLYGEPFPRPGNGPEENFALLYPDAVRRTVIQQLAEFYRQNADTLLRTYGHEPFADAWYRSEVLGWLVVCGSVLAALALIVRPHEPTGRIRRLMASFWLAVGLYLVVYFAITYRMHLKTGYPGAIQARYVFPLLPLLIAASCVGYSHLRRIRPLQVLLVLLAALAVSGLYVTAWTSRQNPKIVFAVAEDKSTGGPLGLAIAPFGAGYVDTVSWQAGQLEINGWAVDEASSRAAASVIVFLDHRFVGLAKPDRNLPGLADRGIVLKGERAGFDLSLMIKSWKAERLCDLDVYAIQDDGRVAPLKVTPCLLRQERLGKS